MKDAKQSNKMNKLYLLLSPVLLASCATGHWQAAQVTTEHHGKVTVVHHRRRVANGSIDHIESINSKGIVTEADVHVFDIGRLPDGNGGVHEAHRYYKIVQDAHPSLQLPRTVSSGPRTVYSPPNYVPPPADQRINDAVTEAKQSKKELDEAKQKIVKRINEDNNLRGQLETEITENQKLQDQLSAAMNTPTKKPTEAQQAAEGDVEALAKWGKSAQP